MKAHIIIGPDNKTFYVLNQFSAKKGTNVPGPQNYCGTVTVLIKQGTNDEKIKKQVQISWDNVPLNPNKVGHLEIVSIYCQMTQKCRLGRILVKL